MDEVIPFPLYDELVKLSKEVEKLDFQKMSGLINSLDSTKMVHIMVIIFHHAFLNRKMCKSGIPYGGKMFNGTKGVKFKIVDLPDDLQKIIWVFIDGPMIN
jgi:hypothetical protein